MREEMFQILKRVDIKHNKVNTLTEMPVFLFFFYVFGFVILSLDSVCSGTTGVQIFTQNLLNFYFYPCTSSS